MSMSVEDQLRAMLGHPDLTQAYHPSQLADLHATLDALAELGEVTLGAHDERDRAGHLDRAWTATVRLRGVGGEPLMASGATSHLAALRCLLEGHCQLGRLMREFSGDLLDELER